MRKLYSRIIYWLVRKEYILEKDIILYEYGIKTLIRGIINFLSILLIGLVFNSLIEALLLTCVVILIRKFAGGIHLESLTICYFCSIGIVIIALSIMQYVENLINEKHLILICLISIILIFIFSPVENYNATITQKEKKIFKKLSITFSSLFFIVMLLSYNYKITFYPIGFGIIISATLMIIGVIQIKIQRILEKGILSIR